MLRSFFMLIAGASMLLGCVTSREVYLADGAKGHNINCSGSGRNYSHCLEKAGDICGMRGFHVLNQQGNIVPLPQAVREFRANTQSVSIGFLTQTGSMVNRNLFIKCK